MRGHVVALHLPVDGDRLALDALAGVEHQDRAVEDAERALDLDGEVDVPWGVDDVDVVVLELLLRAVPHAVRRGGLDRDALLPLEVHRVHLGADAVLAAHLVNLVDAARVKEDALGQRRLARVDVRRDADVADAFEGDSGGHGFPGSATYRYLRQKGSRCVSNFDAARSDGCFSCFSGGAGRGNRAAIRRLLPKAPSSCPRSRRRTRLRRPSPRAPGRAVSAASPPGRDPPRGAIRPPARRSSTS